MTCASSALNQDFKRIIAANQIIFAFGAFVLILPVPSTSSLLRLHGSSFIPSATTAWFFVIGVPGFQLATKFNTLALREADETGRHSPSAMPGPPTRFARVSASPAALPSYTGISPPSSIIRFAHSDACRASASARLRQNAPADRVRISLRECAIGSFASSRKMNRAKLSFVMRALYYSASGGVRMSRRMQ